MSPGAAALKRGNAGSYAVEHMAAQHVIWTVRA